MKRITRTQAGRLMSLMRIPKAMLTGEYRARQTLRPRESMRALSDPVDYFRKALETELEHGLVNEQTNVTGDDLVLTARIVAAHILGVEADQRPLKWKTFPGYYDELWNMEKMRSMI